MKKIFTLLLTCVSLWGYAQDPNPLPQVFSPNAAELGKYGKVPVSYFNGLPNISIPLTELKAKDYTLPIYLTYHAGGNKPEQHPGWVGQGWSLHAGGCISRIVNGRKDEENIDEHRYKLLNYTGLLPLIDPGYLYHAADIQSKDWTNTENFKTINSECEPDEFMVSVEGIQASFFIYGQDQIKIVSQSDTHFSVKYTLASSDEDKIKLFSTRMVNANNETDEIVPLFSYIKTIYLTTDDGTKYTFGGELDAIEFSFSYSPASIGQGTGVGPKGYWNSVANTWNLTSIERPNGERILFEYTRSGMPVTLYDIHYQYANILGEGNSPDLCPIFSSFKDPELHLNLNYFITYPSYLQRITSEMAGDEVVFHASKSRELEYEIGRDVMAERINLSMNVIDTLLSRNRYQKLDCIETRRGMVHFDYSNSCSERLKLLKVSMLDQRDTVMEYSMEYNPMSLPPYNSRRTDAWGYYAYTSPYYCTRDNIKTISETRRLVNAQLMQAEMLTKLTYPTGGFTTFEYEPNTFGSVAYSFPFQLVEENGMAGGLRVKKMTDYSSLGQTEMRDFYYLDGDRSSGILSGYPSFYERGLHTSKNHDIGDDMKYELFSESQSLKQLATTRGSHVTYSAVTEVRSGSGKTECRFYNHDSKDMQCSDRGPVKMSTNMEETTDNNTMYIPLNSFALYRGLLKSRKEYDVNNHLVRSEENTYLQDTTQYVSAISYATPFDSLYRISFYKHFTGFPALKRKTVTTYPDGGGDPIEETTEYTYNSHRQVTRTKRRNGSSSEEIYMSYSGDMPDNKSPYRKMKEAGILDRPVEKTVIRNGRVISSSLTTYRKLNSTSPLFLPYKHYEARLNNPYPSTSWRQYDGLFSDWHQTVYGAPKTSYGYDSFGDINLVAGDDGQAIQYIWDSKNMHPEVSFTGVSATVPKAETYETASQIFKKDLRGLTEYYYEFDAELPGNFSFTMMWPEGWPYDIRGTLDGKTVFDFEYKRKNNNYGGGVEDTEMEISTQLYRGTVTAGHHTLKVFRTGRNQHGGPRDLGAFVLDGDGIISYPVCRVEMQPERIDSWFYGFESDGNQEDGFNSGKSWRGSKTFSCSIPSRVPYTIDWMEKGSSGKWTYQSDVFNGSKTLGRGSKMIDNVRIYPSAAVATNWTWTDRGELSSVTDSKGVTESYEYDGMGRLATVYDTDRNKVTSYDYHYTRPSASIPDSYVRTLQYTNESGSAANALIRYHDGLGRPWQTVSLNAGYDDTGTSTMHLCERTDYDVAGRPYKSWLPFRATSSAVMEASCQPTESLYSDSEPFSQVEYDDSPLERPRAEYGPGADWHTGGKAVRHKYYTNGGSGLLRCSSYSIRRTGDTTVVISRSGIIRDGTLSVKSVTDEDGLTLLTFTDMYGQTLLERRHPVSGEDLDTYYVYDDMGRLSAVIPPALSKLFKTPETTQADINKYAYLYSYDANGNCIAKKLPGCGWTYYIYDKGNRLVFTQDAENRKKGRWLFTFSDIQSRSCVTGYCSEDCETLKQEVSDLNIVAVRQANLRAQYMGYSVSGLSLPRPIILSVSYYDDYGFIDKQIPSDLRSKMLYLQEYDLTNWEYTHGLLTGSAERILGEDITNDFKWTTCYYDRKGNLIQSHTSHADGTGVDISTTKFSFTGKPAQMCIRHSYGGPEELDEFYKYTYEGEWERPKTVSHKIGEDGDWTVLSDFDYDGIGRLKSDTKTGNAALKTSYTYNVRSWNKSITGPGLTEELFYEDGEQGQWGGNISGIHWSAGVGTETFSDSYGYDGLSRLANSTRYGTSDPSHKYINDYVYDVHSNIIKSTFRDEDPIGNGLLNGLFTSKEFTHDGNRLVSGSILTGEYDSDILTPTSVDSRQAAYAYDQDGRLTLSEDQDMTEIRYNDVGYPSYVGMSDGGYVQNTYTAGGLRLGSRRNAPDGVVTAMAYEGNAVMENGKLRMLLFDGGYVDFSGSEPRYCWYTRDHLGSIRAVADANGDIIASYAYGPYGEDFAATGNVVNNTQGMGSTANNTSATNLMLTSPLVTYSAAEAPDWQPYRFSGKESLTRVGLNLYDFGARMFSPFNMRWMTMDPLCERAAHISPYAYCSGNPINRIDTDGMFDKKMFWSGVGAIVKGTVEIAAGGVMLSTGVGAGAAAYLLPVGIASVGAGGALIIGGVSIDDNCENADTATKILKDGPVMSIARACDMATKTETPYFEIGASLFETAFGVATFEVSSNMVVIASDILTIEQGRETFTLIINNTSANNTNSDVEQLTSEKEEIMKFF